LVYSIEETKLHYRGKTRQIENLFEVDPINGKIRLQRSVHHSIGLFELTIAASDINEEIAHIARTVVKIWVCDPAEIGQFVFDRNPRALQHEEVQKYLR
jgi:hypothetical protein